MPMVLTKEKIWSIAPKVLTAVLWLLFIGVCFTHRGEITVDRIVSYTPDKPLVAAVIMLLLFALKSVSLCLYGGILYAASGIIFPLPQALLVNLAGTFIMTVIPYLIGRKEGQELLVKLQQKSEKLELLQSLSQQNGFFVSFFVRMVGLLPGDLVGMYLGASGIPLSKYVPGTMLGLLPAVIAFSVMGMSVDDPTSPAFVISAATEIGLCLLSLVLYFIWVRKKKRI